MASVARRGQSWVVRWRDGTHHRSRSFTRKASADWWAHRVEAERWQPRQVPAAIDPATTLAEWVAVWRESRTHRPSTVDQLDYVARRLGPLGDRPMASLRPSEVQAWVTALSARYAPSTVTTTVGWVRSALSAAVTDGLIASSPARTVRVPAPPPPDVTPYSPAELAALEDAMPDRWALLVRLGSGLGLRLGEALGLTTDRIDWLGGWVTVDRQIITRPDGTRTFGPPKTRAGTRRVPLAEPVALAAAAHLERWGTSTEGRS